MYVAETEAGAEAKADTEVVLGLLYYIYRGDKDRSFRRSRKFVSYRRQSSTFLTPILAIYFDIPIQTLKTQFAIDLVIERNRVKKKIGWMSLNYLNLFFLIGFKQQIKDDKKTGSLQIFQFAIDRSFS